MGTTTMNMTAMLITAMTMLEPRAPGEPVSSAALQRLLAWLSPAFPVGAFSYSHGLEWAVEDGSVKDAPGLEAWLGDVLRHGAGRNDAILFATAYAAAASGDPDRLRATAELAAALQPSKERQLEATAQGAAFLAAVSAGWPSSRCNALVVQLGNATLTYPIAVALAAASHEVPLRPALVAYLAAFVANIVSAGVRAIPVGQSDGQRIIAALAPVVEEIAGIAPDLGPEDVGGAALRADIASMKHETQYSRLFRS
jgi:urease accessory protein